MRLSEETAKRQNGSYFHALPECLSRFSLYPHELESNASAA